MRRTPLFALVASAMLSVLAVAAPALARPEITDEDNIPAPSPGAETQLPRDGRPIVATVVAIDQDTRRVMLSTAHGPLALSVSQEVVERLSVGDVVVVQFSTEDDSPAASPPAEDRGDRLSI